MSKRQRVAELLYRSGALRAILAMRSNASSEWLNILTYHRFPSDDGLEPFDDGVIDATREGFEAQVACLKRHFNVIGADELCALSAGKRLPPNSVAITFDDGYLDCYTHALPILERHQCKAIFFVATSIIGERRVYWWDRIAYLVKQSPREFLRLRYPVPINISLGPDRNQAVERLLRMVKSHQLTQPVDLARFLDELAVAAEVLWSRDIERAFANQLIMTWDQVRALRRAGMDVQSHTRNHRVLQTLLPHELDEELSGSSDDLARELGEPARVLAYPVGNPLANASPIRAALERSGYELGLTNATGPTLLRGRVDRFDIRRHATGPNLSEPLLLSLLALPSLSPKSRWHSLK
jgi:peptidoglycan/xylan/chitin deacetylase (PgdA/CDA1 family)